MYDDELGVSLEYLTRLSLDSGLDRDRDPGEERELGEGAAEEREAHGGGRVARGGRPSGVPQRTRAPGRVGVAVVLDHDVIEPKRLVLAPHVLEQDAEVEKFAPAVSEMTKLILTVPLKS